MAEGGGHFADEASPAQEIELLTTPFGFFFCALPGSDVHGDADKPARAAIFVVNATTPSRDPADGAIWQNDAVLRLVVSARRNGVVDCRLSARAIFRVDATVEIGVRDCGQRWEVKELAKLIGNPELVGFSIEFPNSDVGGFHGEGDPFLDFMERL